MEYKPQPLLISKKKIFLMIFIYLIIISIATSAFYSNSIIGQIKNYYFNKFECDTNAKNFSSPKRDNNFVWQNTGLITLWFDDGYESQFTEAPKLLDKFGYKGAIAITTSFICKPEMMSWNQLRELQAHGWEVTSHALHHYCDFYKFVATDDKEFKESKQILQSKGFNVNTFVIPCGPSINLYPEIQKSVEENYSSYRDISNDSNPLPITNPYNIHGYTVFTWTSNQEITNAINDAINNKYWLVFVFHRISTKDNKSSYSISVDKLNWILEQVKASGLPVVLPYQVLDMKIGTVSKAKEIK